MCNLCGKQITDSLDLEYCEVCAKIHCKGCSKLRMKNIGQDILVCNDCHVCFDDHIEFIQKYGLKKYRKITG
jgi:hypothetical protein